MPERPPSSPRPLHRLALIGGAMFVALVVAGCAQPKNTISEIDPYLGQKPAQVAQLGPKPQAAPPTRGRKARAGGASSGWLPPGGISSRWQCIVIHHSDSDRSTPQGIRDWHVRGRGWDELGYHFVIGNGIGYGDGQIYVGQRWTKQMHGAHCKTPGNHYNDHGIGICLIGDLQNHPPTSRQVDALARLISFLSDQCDIPRAKVLTHGGITHKTACPGRCFNLGAVLQRLSSLSASADDAAGENAAELTGP